MVSRRVFAGVAGLALAAAALAGCTSKEGKTSASGSSEYAKLSGQLKASGASFPNAYYQKALDEFSKDVPEFLEREDIPEAVKTGILAGNAQRFYRL